MPEEIKCPACEAEMLRALNQNPHDKYTFHYVCPSCGMSKIVIPEADKTISINITVEEQAAV